MLYRFFFPPLLLAFLSICQIAAADTLDEIAPELENTDPQVRVAAVQLLIKQGVSATPYLLKAVEDKDEQVRLSAALGLQGLHTEEKRAAVALGELLSSADANVQGKALAALRELGPGAAPAVHRIEVALHKNKIGVAAVDLLAAIATENAIDGLARVVSHQDPAVEDSAVRALGSLGPKAQTAVESLLPAIEDRRIGVAVVQTLGKIGGPRAIHALTQVLHSDNSELQVAAIEGLGLQGRDARAALPTLRNLAESSNQAVSEAAMGALESIRQAFHR